MTHAAMSASAALTAAPEHGMKCRAHVTPCAALHATTAFRDKQAWANARASAFTPAVIFRRFYTATMVSVRVCKQTEPKPKCK